ncbi:FG-GAP-like repeat-containing protein [Streptomyces sp. NPDC046887]|uniref:FG-GAP-like repeat-containing protein n=1 Tax=Streptomyces sp. NPDC046887 TaxID=3155472 RepID=UPI0033F1EDEB
MRVRAWITALAIVLGTVAGLGLTAGRAVAAGLATTPLITYNMQGGTKLGETKWTDQVQDYARSAEIVALQEAGAAPPGEFVQRFTFDPNAPGRSGYVQHHRWVAGQASYEVYFLQVDPNGGGYTGGRNNLAIVTQRPADEVRIIANPYPGGRNVLGVRFGENWYFTYHALSGGGVDVQRMADAVNRYVRAQGPNRTWTLAGDFNRDPGTVVMPPQTWMYRTFQPTHIGGEEFDYALSSENLPNHPVERLPGASADHNAVSLGQMRAAAEPPELRILPFGDSITFGAGSSTSAYRGPLYDELRRNQTHTEVSYVGSQHYGSVPDNDNEGHPGWQIDQLSGIADSVMDTYKPNVVLLHIGTNDMNENVDPAGAPARLGALMDRIFAKQPDVSLIVSTLVPSANPTTEGRIFYFNQSIPRLVGDRRDQGRKIWMVDGWKALSPSSDLADFLHPNDEGYRKLGHAFHQGIESIEWAGWVDPPTGGGDGPGGGSPVRSWFPQGTIASGTLRPHSYPGNLSLGSGDRIHFADLSGDGRADFLVSHADGNLDVWNNGGVNTDGTVAWTSRRTINTGNREARWFFGDVFNEGRANIIQLVPGDKPTTLKVRRGDGGTYTQEFGTTWVLRPEFADVSGDGLVDWLWIAPDSAVDAFIHNPPGPERPWSADSSLPIATGVGVSPDKVRFADLNGDRRADYLVLNGDSSVRAWINGGPGGSGYRWYPQGTIASGVGVSGERIRFADVTGDRKADYLDVDPVTGNTRMWRNDSSPEDGWPWSPQGSITVGNSARVLYADINGDKKADYLQVGADSSVQAWLNGGPKPEGGDHYWTPAGTIAGGVGKPGANVTFADLNADHRADYIVVNPDGSVQAWLNDGPSPHGGDWYWLSQGTVAGGVGEAGSSIRLSDLNGDGRADYLVVHPDGLVRAWLNGGPKPGGGDYLWSGQGTIAGGVGAQGRTVRFSDLDGDRRADYLVLHDSSALDMWSNGGPKPGGGDWYWTSRGQVASGVLVPGSRIQFADIDGDGREDYLDVDPATGATRGWINSA